MIFGFKLVKMPYKRDFVLDGNQLQIDSIQVRGQKTVTIDLGAGSLETINYRNGRNIARALMLNLGGGRFRWVAPASKPLLKWLEENGKTVEETRDLKRMKRGDATEENVFELE